jgi:rare lipoprotein A
MAPSLTVSGAIALALVAFAPGNVSAAERGIASSYPSSYQGRRTASGERLNAQAMTCAHRRHPFGSMLRVSVGVRSIVCRVTDRGPFVRGRIIDLTPAGARALGMTGLARVMIEQM